MDHKTDGRRPAAEKGLSIEDFELAKQIRGELVGYLFKVSLAAGGLVLAALGSVIWLYIEWRLPQIAGGVPKNAVMAFAQEGGCPEGWTDFARARMRMIVGAEPDGANSDRTSPRPLYSGEQRGNY